MYKSEAQAYQAWRRDLKKERNKAQRYQNIYSYKIYNGKPHPSVLRYRIGMSENPSWDAIWWQDKVSMNQMLLNKYEVENG